MMKIFVISRRSARQRRKSVTEQFEKISQPVEFFDAIESIEGLEGHFQGIDEQIFRLNTYRSPLPGEIGCYASHFFLWEKAIDLNEPIIVLEDDCRLLENFTDAIRAVEASISEFGFIRLEGFDRPNSLKPHRSPQLICQASGFAMHYLSNVPLCLLGYAVSPASAAQLRGAGRRISSPVDKFVQRTWEHRTPIFALAPSCVETASLADESTIGDRRSPRKRELVTALRRASYKLAGELKRRQFDNEQLTRLFKRAGSARAARDDAGRGGNSTTASPRSTYFWKYHGND